MLIDHCLFTSACARNTCSCIEIFDIGIESGGKKPFCKHFFALEASMKQKKHKNVKL